MKQMPGHKHTGSVPLVLFETILTLSNTLSHTIETLVIDDHESMKQSQYDVSGNINCDGSWEFLGGCRFQSWVKAYMYW